MDIRDKLSSIEKRILEKIKYRVFDRSDIFRISGFSDAKIKRTIESLLRKKYIEKVFFSNKGAMLRKVKSWDVLSREDEHKNILQDIFSFFTREGVYSVNTWARWAVFNGGFVVFLLEDGFNVDSIEGNNGVLESFVLSLTLALKGLKKNKRERFSRMNGKKKEEFSEREYWDSLVGKVEVSSFRKGDRICMSDIENMGCFDLEAEEDGYCIDTKGMHGVHLVVPKRFFENAIDCDQREKDRIEKISKDAFSQIPKKPKIISDLENEEKIYYCDCKGKEYSVSKFNDFTFERCKEEYPPGFPDSWKDRNGRCSDCGSLIKTKKVL